MPVILPLAKDMSPMTDSLLKTLQALAQAMQVNGGQMIGPK
jgi:hypothetical protein